MGTALDLFLYFSMILVAAAFVLSHAMGVILTIRIITLNAHEKRIFAEKRDSSIEIESVKQSLIRDSDAALSEKTLINMVTNVRISRRIILLVLLLMILLWFIGDSRINMLSSLNIFWTGIGAAITFALYMIYRLICSFISDVADKSSMVRRILRKGCSSYLICMIIYGIVYVLIG